MDESGEDLISNLPDSVVCHILSRLPTNHAIRTLVLSKDWEHKWTSIYNIQIDDHKSRYACSKDFVNNVDRILRLIRNSRQDNFNLSYCHKRSASHRLKTSWIPAIVKRDIKHLQIYAELRWAVTFPDDLYSCRSLTKLELLLNCTLNMSLMKNGFPSLKVLYLNDGVKLVDDETSSTGKVIINFPVLEQVVLRCIWQGAKSVEINTPALIKCVANGWHLSNIKLNSPKLQKFQSNVGFLENLVVIAPSVLRARFFITYGSCASKGLHAHETLKGFPVLECLQLGSDDMVKVLLETNSDYPLPCFNRLKQLKFRTNDETLLMKLLQVMPSLESLFLYVDHFRWVHEYEGLESFPSDFASSLKLVKLIGYENAVGQISLVQSVLKNVENLEKLIVSVGYRGESMLKTEIKSLLETFPKSSTRALIVVT